MMPLSPFPNRNIGRDCSWAWPGHGGACLKKRHGGSKPATCPLQVTVHAAAPHFQHRQHHQNCRQSLLCWHARPPACSSNPHSPPIGCGTRVPCTPRFRALALFGRLPSACVDSSVMQASENLHMSCHLEICKGLGGNGCLRSRLRKVSPDQAKQRADAAGTSAHALSSVCAAMHRRVNAFGLNRIAAQTFHYWEVPMVNARSY